MPLAVSILAGLAGCTRGDEPPPGMVAIAAGGFVRGLDDATREDERPAHTVTLSAYFIDEALVTVADFRAFVGRSGHTTSAESLGFGMVAYEGLDDWEWVKTEGATWRQPWGLKDPAHTQADDEPVVMVSWEDAAAYCAHHGKRLPTEAEWEHAMRAGQGATRYPWGDDPHRDGRLGLNFWQGTDHRHNTLLDGYRYTSPVRAFPPNRWGLYDPVGNTWQWTADWYAADTYEGYRDGVTDPTGPDTGWARVARGGSWWCSAHACSGFGLHDRGKSRPGAPFNNNSFRCARDAG